MTLTGRRRLANLLLAAAFLACAVLLLYPPAGTTFYPACPIRQYLHIDCPGCGATRALAALLRGHIAKALRLNALFVLLLPVALAGAIESYRRALRPERFRWHQPPMPAVYATLTVAVTFTIARNLL
ncbi:MAG TPA: DUF2752 domain-containing protein [Acidobacteriaceae bacterium]